MTMTDSFDYIVFDHDCAVEKDAALRIHGYDSGVMEYEHRAAAALSIRP